MGNNNTTKIDGKAVTDVKQLFLLPASKISPHIEDNSSTPLLDGYIRIYKDSDFVNNDSLGDINVQVKGQTQNDIDFKEVITYSIDSNLLKISYTNLGLSFFVVRMEATNYTPIQVYYNLLTFEKITKLLEEINDQKHKSIPLVKFPSLKEFTIECMKLIDNKYFLVSQINKKNTEIIDKYIAKINAKSLEDPWLKSIYYDGKTICNKHPLLTIYNELNNDYKLIIFVGEPRLGKSYEMLSLYLNHVKNKYIITRFYELSQYQGGNLEKDLFLCDEYLPYNIILDGYDEISPYHIKKFNSELYRITNKYNETKIIISTRERCKDNIPYIDKKTEIYLIPITINDLLTSSNDSEEKNKILSLGSDQLKELFLIPIYRPIINEIKEDESIYDTLIKFAIIQNRSKISAKYGDKALVSDDELIEELTAISIKMQSSNIYYIERTEQENLLFETDFLKTYDGRFYIFYNKTYQDYFVALYYTKKTIDEIHSFFFINKNLKVAVIDIFVIFYDLVRYNNKILYDELFNKLESISIEAFLITDLSLIPEDSRYDYFIEILENRNKNKKYIYYARSRPEFGPLKNVSNMAKKMQELLPSSKRKNAFNVLKENIRKYLEAPDADTLISFANSIILINRYSDILWEEDDLESLKYLSKEIIKFFLYNEIAWKIKELLTYHSIILWYKDYSWTEKWTVDEWESFFKNILKNDNSLNSIINTDMEFTFKIAVFNSFHETTEIQTILKPILIYSIEINKKVSKGTIDIISENITDDDVYPVVHIDHYLWVFYEIIKKIDVSLDIILETLIFSINKQSKQDFFGIHNPIIILENKLYDKIDQLTAEQYKLFSEYFLHRNTLHDIHRFFEIANLEHFDNLKIYLLKKINDEKVTISQWILESLLAKLLNLSDVNKAKKQFDIIKEIYKTENNIGIYKGIIYMINLNIKHILHDNDKIKNDYQYLFADHIEAKKKHNEQKIKTKEKIDKMQNNEINLVLDNDAILEELSKAVDYLNNPDNLNENKTFIGKVRSLESEHILNCLEYNFGNEYKSPPIFSKTVLFIIEYFIGANYLENTINKTEILKYVKKWQAEPFYIFFYWIYIKQYAGDLLKQVFNQINKKEELKIILLDSMKNEIPEKFKNKKINDFDGMKSTHWLSPFLYYIKYLMDNKIPEYVSKDDALKLIACGNPYGEHAMMSYSVNLAWFEDLFIDMISQSEIVQYGLENIDMLQNSLSRLQIFNYLLEYYEKIINKDFNTNIKNYIIKKTREMFLEENRTVSSSEYSPISNFWSKCEENHVDDIFPHFNIDIVLSVIRINDKDINYQYRKTIIEYCIHVSTELQKKRIINEIKDDSSDMGLTLDQSFVVNHFLASMGDEENILSIIDGYLNGDIINTPDIFTMYKFGCLHKTETLLNKYIELLFYSTNLPDNNHYIRREKLFSLARNGIEQNISIENFAIFHDKAKVHISDLQKENKYTDFYEDFLLQMEQNVYSYCK
ncbi:MAG: hypothetical protein FWB83_00960 [Treponema sp.]|nr:hypothetical protein [Treponema sp.]